MELTDFEASLSRAEPAADLPPMLLALWHDAKGDWERAHRIVQAISGATAAWIHAYLHRKEGDTWNADYWYTRADRRRPSMSLEAEWQAIVSELLRSHG